MTLIEGALFSAGLAMFAFGVVWLNEQVTAYTISCACGRSWARRCLAIAKHDAVEADRTRALLTENCPTCRHFRANPQSTIDNRQSKGFSHVS